MLSSISSSNYKAKVFLLLAMFIGTYFSVNTLAFYKIKHRYAVLEQKNIYVNDVQGMYHLMKKQYPKGSLDIVFLGNSTTKVQVSSEVFQKQNLRVFNYGLVGYTISHYPAMVKNAIKEKPKIIVISIKEPELYFSLPFFYKNYYHQLDLNLATLGFMVKHIRHRDDFHFVRQLALSYVGTKNYFILYGYRFTDKIKNTYEKYGKLNITSNKNNDEPQPLDFCSSPYDASYNFVDCRNGDAFLDGIASTIPYSSYHEISYHDGSSYDYTLASMFNSLIKEIKKAGIRPVIVMIPEFKHHIYVDQNITKKTLDADIIDLSDMDIPREGWYNEEHLNKEGREVYSKKMVEMIKPLIPE
jgi:hypothetical protein